MKESESFLAYKEYVESKSAAGSGKPNAYLAVLSKIGKILKSTPKFVFLPDDITTVKNLELLHQIYEFVKEEQKKPNGGVFDGTELTKGYWGKSFCSAAIQDFMKFRMETCGELVTEKTYKKTVIELKGQVEINIADFIAKFAAAAKDAGLIYETNLIKRFVCALLAKPFVVLTGLSGSGKTKLAQAFTQWIAVEGTSQVVPVGADWANSEKMLGYPNGLDPENYILPDTGVLKMLIDANDNPDVPFFLILDEMNLSHVERYFADFLSAMESKGKIKLYDGEQRSASNGMPVPNEIPFPQNLFVIGTMNVDETTHAFSPKVLDRAQVIEFRVDKDDLAAYLDGPKDWKPEELDGRGKQYGKAFLALHNNLPPMDAPGANANRTEIANALKAFFEPLAKLGTEFGYRTASEVMHFCAYYLLAGADVDSAIDASVMQKLLPKLHGSQARLMPTLKSISELAEKDVEETDANGDKKKVKLPKYALTYEKVERMKVRVQANGFTSFAEA